ncbi:MAG: TerB family tellurite resistance protein [Anaerolineae bacterium]|nr:TerB family tellurite resistance protein [Anaerolineae bacterium]
MPDTDLMLTLGKVIIAAAWADGAVSNDEVNSLKDLLIHLPNLTARHWATLDMYIETPVDAAERARLVEELRAALRSPADRALALAALNDLVTADGAVTEAEQRVVAEIEAALASADVGIFGALARLFKGPVARRSQAADAPNREAHFEDFLKNKVYYEMRRRLNLGEGDVLLPDDTLRRLGLASGIMAQVARVSGGINAAEFAAIVDALQQHWGVSREEAAFVAEAATADVTANLDAWRLAREFVDTFPYAQRVRFLDVLFAVCAADGKVSRAEVESIRAVARSMLVSRRDFIDAKLKVPRAQREA